MYKAGVLFFFCSSLVRWTASAQPALTPTDPRGINSQLNSLAKPIPVSDLFTTRSIEGPSWSTNGKWIAFSTNLTGRFNIYKVSSRGGWPLQMVQSEESQFLPTFSTDDRWIVYQQDRGGNEKWNLFAIPAEGGEPRQLTDASDAAESSPRFSRDGRWLAFNYKLVTSAATDIAVRDWPSGRLTQLTHEATKDHVWQLLGWDPNSRSLFATRTNAGFTDSDVYRIDVPSGRMVNLTAHRGEILYAPRLTPDRGAGDVSPNGRMLLISSNEKGGYANVLLLDIATKKKTWVTDINWDSKPGSFSPDGMHFTYTVSADGKEDTYLAKLGSAGKRLSIPDGISYPDGAYTSFSPDGKTLLINHESPQEPADEWVYSVGSGRLMQLTFSSIASLTPTSLPPARVIHYRSFDGTLISAVLYMPFNLKRDGSNPVVVLPHGGPTSQTIDDFSATAAALASRGYICIAPNVRGSTGYGMEFQKANVKDLGGGDLQDEVFAVKWLEQTGYVDPKRVGISGSSYGGYMALMAIGKTPEIWAAAVDAYGILDWFTVLKHADPFLQEYNKSLLGDTIADRMIYENSSPLKYIRNAKAPLLVLQGDNDVRVPKEESEQVVSILRGQGKTVEVKFYADEGHGFKKRDNKIDAILRTIAWFDKHLKGAA